jgi:hypothetical protein
MQLFYLLLASRVACVGAAAGQNGAAGDGRGRNNATGVQRDAQLHADK